MCVASSPFLAGRHVPGSRRLAGPLPLSRPALPSVRRANTTGVVRGFLAGRWSLACPPPPALSVDSPLRRGSGSEGRCGGRVAGEVGRVASSVGPVRRVPPLSGLACPPRSCPGYLAVAFRRGGLKTPGGVALPPPGSGGGGARRGSRGRVRRASRFLLLARLAPLRLYGPSLSRRRRFPRPRSGAGGVESPLWAPVGSRPARRLARSPARALPVPGVGGIPCRSRSGLSRSRPSVFLNPRVCFRSLADRPEANPRSVGGTVPSVSTVSPLTLPIYRYDS